MTFFLKCVIILLFSKRNNMSEEKNGYGIVKDRDLKPESKGRKFLRTAIYTLLSSISFSFGFHYMVAPSKFAPGGIAGVIALIQFITKSNAGGAAAGLDFSPFLLVVVTIPILIPAWKILPKEFSVKTFVNCLLMSVMIFALDNFIDPAYEMSIAGIAEITDVGTRIIAAIFGGILSGFSLACALKINSSSGGVDVVAAMVQKKNPHKSVASIIFIINSVVILVSVPIYKDNLMPVYLALIFIFVSMKTSDIMLQGSKSALKFEVITEHGEEISKEIIEKLGHGVTVTPAEGMFERKEKQLLICIIKPRQVAGFQEILKKYPDTFAYVGQVNEIIGKFNKRDKRK